MRITNISNHKFDFEISDRNALLGSHFPEFLIVGPQRTATTWLHRCLSKHPQVLMPNQKELYFFSLLDEKNHRFYCSNDLNWYIKQFNVSNKEVVKLKLRNIRKYLWPYKIKVRGEATASYAALDVNTIKQIIQINPKIKVIFGVREPGQRAWSHAKKDLVRNAERPFSTVSRDEFFEFFKDPYIIKCGQVVKNIRNWQNNLKKGQLYLMQYEDVNNKPKETLNNVLKFLGISTRKRIIDNIMVTSPVNTTSSEAIPDEIRGFLEKLYSEENALLKSTFGITYGE